ncbi:hypothetical protein COO60DRAFT_1029535 [Scenedesmus sp. NREL 46B-D3]|nr:hypothetical protein COO60DRAFT_1029535 [Scenedesmus sp. NREL 46B-D3]
MWIHGLSHRSQVDCTDAQVCGLCGWSNFLFFVLLAFAFLACSSQYLAGSTADKYGGAAMCCVETDFALVAGFNPCCVHRRRGNSASLHKSAPRCAAYGGCWRAACPCTLAGSGLSEVCCRLMRLSWRPPAALRPSQISRPDSSSPGVFWGVHRPGFALLQRQLKGAQRQRGARQQRKRTITMGMLLGWVLQLLRGWSGRVQCVVLACVLGVFGMLRRSNLVPGSRRCLWAGSTCGVVLLCWSPATCSLPHSP